MLSNPVLASLARMFIYGRRGFIRQASSGDIEKTFLIHLDFRGRNVYSIGSSGGDFTQFFAASVGKKGCVVAFEPNPNVYQHLKHRIGRDIGSNVLAVNMCVGLAQGNSLLIVRNDDTGTGSIDPDIQNQIISEGDYHEINVPICSLDSYVASNGGKAYPNFIKIDAEGAEFDILKGAVRVLQSCPELFIEIHGATRAQKEKNIEDIIRFLQEYGYSIYHIESGQKISFTNSKVAKEGHIYCCK